MTGAELGGALKNVVALAAGMAIGAGFGESARAAIITRGFAEMMRFATAAGARPETLMGLSGLGDLDPDRELREVAQLPDRARARPRPAAGLRAAPSRASPPPAPWPAWPTERGIDMPLARTVARVTAGEITVAEAGGELLARPLKAE